MNPNNCDTCGHKRHPDGGWCYMFREEPMGVCRQHTARIASPLPIRSQNLRAAGFTRRQSAKSLPSDE
jgi:hypothetical protein